MSLAGSTRPLEGTVDGSRLRVVAIAGLLFACIFALRLAVADPDAAILMMCVAPTALLAAELGLRGGLAAAILSASLVVVWAELEAASIGFAGYATRIGTFLLVGVLIGWLADRGRALEEQGMRNFQLSLDLLSVAGFDGYLKRVNPAFERALGYSAEELCSRPFLDFVHPDDRQRTQAEAAKLAGGSTDTVGFRNRYRAKDGRYRWIEWTANAVPSERLIYASARDVTERADTGALRSQLAAIVDSSDDAILSKDLDGTIVSWNRGAEKLYGYSSEEIVGRSVSTLIPPERPGEVTDILERIRRGEPVEHFETVRVSRDGTRIPVSLMISPVRDGEGEIIGASTIARDISERVRMEAALGAARDAEAEANRLKSDFLATMSHEIRTPMNGVIGMAGLLLDTDLDADQRRYAEAVRSSGDALLTIINEILDFSKIEAGRLELEEVDFDLRTLVEDVADLLAERAHAKGLELAVLVEPDVPSHVRGDPGRLRQIVANLLGNAVKFTEWGEVVIRVERAAETDHDARVRFEVADTGVGVAPERQDMLFEPFSQADASTTRTHGGTGLGLTITKRLVELMGGEIGLESAPGEGSRFSFTARLAKAPASGPQLPTPRDDLRDLRVLIVDDNETNREILDRQVGSWGMRSRLAEGGERALDLLRRAAAGDEPYDVALLDMNMPGMDGLELARRIRSDRELPPTPLLLLTSSGVRGSADLARQAGISAFLAKPVRQSQLYDAIALVMGSGAPRPPLVTRHTVSEAKARSRPRLLLAEDNPVNQQVAVAMLQKIGYRADVVSNGLEAVVALSRGSYGAILMDCQMPEMDGYEATGEIRRREGGSRRTPIIAMTAGAMQDDRARCFAAGMDDYISKPVELDRLAHILRRWVEGEDDGDEVPDEGGRGSTTDAVDHARLSELRSLQRPGEPDVLAELIEPFLHEAHAQLAALRAAVANCDADALKQTAHALKGSAANLAAPRIAAICAELEALDPSRDRVSAAKALSRLEIELERATAAFETELGKTGP